MTNFELVREFHRAIGAPDPGRPAPLPPDRMRLRRKLLEEEYLELLEALDAYEADPSPENLAQVAKESADLKVVTYGLDGELGLPADVVFAAVHRSNMSKIGGPVRPDGKALKGPNYQPADLSFLLERESPARCKNCSDGYDPDDRSDPNYGAFVGPRYCGYCGAQEARIIAAEMGVG